MMKIISKLLLLMMLLLKLLLLFLSLSLLLLLHYRLSVLCGIFPLSRKVLADDQVKIQSIDRRLNTIWRLYPNKEMIPDSTNIKLSLSDLILIFNNETVYEIATD